MSKIFFDTNLFVYLFEHHPVYTQQVQSLLSRMEERGDELVTSWMTVAEVQVKPKALGDETACHQYRNAIKTVAKVVAFDEGASDAYLYLRTRTKVKGPDSIQLACAAAEGVEIFVTNDYRLQRISVPGIHFIAAIDRVPV